MPSEPEPPPPRGWPRGFGSGEEERRALLTLSELRGLRPLAVHAEAWGTGSAAGCLESVRRGRIGSDGDRRWLTRIDPAAADDRVAGAGARIVTPTDPEYEERLLDLSDPPACLFVRGRSLGDLPDRVAIVGSRRCSDLGRDVAHDLGRALVAAGLAVVSGAAHGIDAAAHHGAVRAGGRTVAVLGSGIDVAYPASSRLLLARIAEGGTIVSEYPPGTPTGPQHFPARNRIVVALARALVVVEGEAKSGSRISVDHALELGREVFAVPGPVTSPLAETPLEMIRDGATLIRGADDLLDDLGIDRAAPPPAPPDLEGVERRLWEALAGRLVPDAIARRAGMSVPEVMTTLVRLELRGLVSGEGGRYERRLRSVLSGPPRTTERVAPPPSG
ncbi:MAG: DNA-processing protein DprA [Actinomycetota bacterium]